MRNLSPYYIYLKNQEVFSFAGIWEQWIDRETGECCKTYSILTTEANALMAKIHTTKKRMPVILPAEAERQWLERGLGAVEIRKLTQPLDASRMEAHTISKLITSRTQNRNAPAVRESYPYPELAGL